MLGLYPISSGATCSNYTSKTADYSSSYDTFGNVTSRTTNSVTDTLSYDLLDQLTKWSSNATGQTQLEQYVYDAEGNRVLRRSTSGPSSGPTTTMTVYAFGLEEHNYTGSGTNQGNTYYYSLAGRLIGSNDANGTVFYMTDILGSVLASFTNAPGGATLKGNQVYGPYGNARYNKGSINTAKGFTGQYNDSLTGLDYYNARYYDPVAGVFLSADVKQGNMQGVNPYAYVNGNPETNNDPTGLRPIQVCPSGCDAPVDMAALSAEIVAWSGIANASPYKVDPALIAVSSVTGGAAATSPYKDVSVQQLSSSCGLSQGLCGHYGVYFAMYFGGFQIGVPGEWCIDCGQPGGSSDSSGSSGGSGDVSQLSGDAGGGTIQDGSLTIEPNDGQPYTADEIAAAKYVASIYDNPDDSVILRPATGQGRTSDLMVNGKSYDIYTPQTNSVRSIMNAILKKNDQATGIVLNLSNTTVTRGDLVNLMVRMLRAQQAVGKTLNIDDIIIYDAPFWNEIG